MEYKNILQNVATFEEDIMNVATQNEEVKEIESEYALLEYSETHSVDS